MSIIEKIRNGEPIGFRMTEDMVGTHEFVGGAGPAGEFPMSFHLEWGPDNLAEFLNPADKESLGVNRAEGTVTVGGLVEDAPCEGKLELMYFSESKIRYSFSFTYEGRRYDFVGEKVDIKPWNLHKTHTTCYGTLTDELGNVVSKSVTYFKLESLPAFLGSFRLV